jgi:hypothetical protein
MTENLQKKSVESKHILSVYVLPGVAVIDVVEPPVPLVDVVPFPTTTSIDINKRVDTTN